MVVGFSPQADSSIRTGELYLQLQVQSGFQGVLPLSFAQEALIVTPRQFTLLPNQPAWVLGLFNYRNQVIWGLDLSQFLGWDPLDFGLPEYHLVVVRLQALRLGLAVQLVKGVTRLAADRIQSVSGSPGDGWGEIPISNPCFSGQVMDGGNPLWVLNPKGIAQQLDQARAGS
ncbi:chemotaxis protein CheW [Thermostichus vulcanus]|uniref:Chemotaxis protein CheW n=1 Tax=Thermostichus vulcanus str. 'Rupite' TaxID=2813851 RepID=A0ABT0C9C4_THEVL|nr:chemotaxis protein CheW [Thermostichus vulcanus]MCJ2542379.1 chemotaxis protein CheW [Thermostichus vulcanus str. 'Rupite']